MSNSKQSDQMRREFIKKAAYIAPVILTLKAMPALAQVGSGAPVTPGDPGDPGAPGDYDDWSFDSRPVPAVTPERAIAGESSPAGNTTDPFDRDWCVRERGPEPPPRGPRSSKPWYRCD